MKIVFFLLIATCAFSALPPLAQNNKELKAVLEDPKLYQLLGSHESIQEILRTERGYLIVAEHRSLDVIVHYEKSGERHIGPARFTLEFAISQ